MTGRSIARYIQALSFGGLKIHGPKIEAAGHIIFSVPDEVAPELVDNDRAVANFKSEIVALERSTAELAARNVWREGERSDLFLRKIADQFSGSREYSRKFRTAYEESKDQAEFSSRIAQIKADLQNQIDEVQSRTTAVPMLSFSGSVRRAPEYVIPLVQELARIELLHFRETRQPIGPEEAAQLLRLKTTRGGPEQLAAFQSTVRSLLGVTVDAFEAEESPFRADPFSRTPPRAAEMDIDEFLVEANGAGIREALRILLDLELKKPDIALIEEPEVHLHPGLEKVMHRYLVQKGETTQIFLATHSTGFLDTSTQQNVYIVSKGGSGSSGIERAISEDEILRIPSERGLRPSTFFMFDRLVFVEGPTDEAVLAELARSLKIDLSATNVGFVRMGGSSNAGHFASDATLELLSRRQIPMTFIVDRDERDDAEMARVSARLGNRAKFHLLQRRELENYLLAPDAIQKLIVEKRTSTRERDGAAPALEIINTKLRSAALSLKDRVIELRVAREVMRPIYIDRAAGEDPATKMRNAAAELSARVEAFAGRTAEITNEVASEWDAECFNRAPGSEILSIALKEFGFAYHKERDAIRLARFTPPESITEEVRRLLRQIGS